jgi:hypothetical protein
LGLSGSVPQKDCSLDLRHLGGRAFPFVTPVVFKQTREKFGERGMKRMVHSRRSIRKINFTQMEVGTINQITPWITKFVAFIT